MPYLVKLIKAPQLNTYNSNYFPRGVHYKKEAEEIRDIVHKNGGIAEIENLNKKGLAGGSPTPIFHVRASNKIKQGASDFAVKPHEENKFATDLFKLTKNGVMVEVWTTGSRYYTEENEPVRGADEVASILN